MLVDDGGSFGRRTFGAWNGVAKSCAVLLALAAYGPRPGGGAPPGETYEGAGRVTEKGTGRPIAGVSIAVRRYLWPDPATGENRLLGETTHRTDGDGNFRYSVPIEPPSELQSRLVLKVEHPDYPPELEYPESPRVMRKNEALGERYVLDLELSPGKPVTGTVETPDGKPAAGVKVKASSYFAPEAKPGNLVMGSMSETRTDDRGRFRFVAITPGEATISLFPGRFATSVRDVREDKRGDLGRFVLKEGVSVSGKVLDAEGKPLANVIVNAAGSSQPPPEGSIEAIMPGNDTFSRSTLTDAGGEFKLPPLPAGVYRVTPTETDPGAEWVDAWPGGAYRALPAPFAPLKVTLKDGEPIAPLVFRPIASVAVQVRVVDSKGAPSRGLSLLLGGMLPEAGKGDPQPGAEQLSLGGEFWAGQGWPDAAGKLMFHAPRGLTYASIDLGSITDEHHALRYRLAKDAPLSSDRQLQLDPLDHDVKGAEIVSYESPILLVKVAAADGSQLRDVHVTAVHPRAVPKAEDGASLAEDPRSALHFYEQKDGRHRSARLLPDEEVTVTAIAKGFAPKSASFTLPEASTRAVELVLDKE